VLDAGDQGAEIKLSDHARRRIGRRGGIDKGPLSGALPAGDVPAKAGHVAPEIVHRFLERDEDPGFARVQDACGKELGREDGFATAGRAGDKRRATERQTAAGDMVEAVDI
jgi:hypothetical protein